MAIFHEGGGSPSGPVSSPANQAPKPVGNVFNCDSFGYNSKIIKKTPTQMSWAELLNPTWKGRVALLNDANIGLQDAAIAAEARGMIKFKDLGNMTKSEIDGLVKILTKYKKQGHFRAFWTSFDQSVNLMSADPFAWGLAALNETT